MSDTTDRDLLLALVAAQDEVSQSYEEMCRQVRIWPCRRPGVYATEGNPRWCWRTKTGCDQWCDNCKRTRMDVIRWRVAKERLGLARAAVTRRGHQLMKEAQGE